MSTTIKQKFSLKKRSDLHLARKIWHILSVIAILITYKSLSQGAIDQILAVAWIGCLLTEIIRFQSEKFNQFVIATFGPVMRQGEINKVSGLTYMLAGVTLVYTFFSPNVIALSFLFLGFADPIASYVGIRFGKRKILSNKTLEGFIGAFLTCFVISLIFLNQTGKFNDSLLLVSLLTGLSGALAEGIPLGQLDDNLTLPVISAVLISIIFSLFAGAPL